MAGGYLKRLLGEPARWVDCSVGRRGQPYPVRLDAPTIRAAR